MGCISLLSLIRRLQGNEILLLLKYYDLWIGSTAPVAYTLSMRKSYLCMFMCKFCMEVCLC